MKDRKRIEAERAADLAAMRARRAAQSPRARRADLARDAAASLRAAAAGNEKRSQARAAAGR